MSDFRDRKAATAPVFDSLFELIEEAVVSRKAQWGWVGGRRLCVAYPGGRNVEYPAYKFESWQDIPEQVGTD